uniref:Uncharacterized protein n=1 Tax=Anguilla anguilla TaxID=7936 RepID=A0A0E9WI09_ANGAN
MHPDSNDFKSCLFLFQCGIDHSSSCPKMLKCPLLSLLCLNKQVNEELLYSVGVIY